MRDKVDTLYAALDEMALSMIDRTKLNPDPNRAGEFCVWPDTFLAYKASVIARERDWNEIPTLTDLQWLVAETYMRDQYKFGAISKEKRREYGGV